MFQFPFRLFVILGILILPLTKQEDQEKITAHLEPANDFYLASGSQLDLTCRLSPCGADTPSGIHLVRLGRPLTHGSQHIKGPCAVTLTIPNVTTDDAGTFECRYDGWTGGLSPRPTMLVGDPPRAERFKCISANFASANCSWCSKTKHGFEYENTTLQFSVGGVTHSCAKFIDDCTCHICGYDSYRRYGFRECKPDPKRKHFVKYAGYTFNLIMRNKFGITRRTIKRGINMTNVKPDIVTRVQVLNISATSAKVVWGPPEGLRSYHGALDLNYWLSYSSKYEKRNFTLGPQVFNHLLHGLWPYTEYTIELKSKPIRGGYFSDCSTTTVTTMEAAPAACPVVSIGGYLSVISESNARIRTVYVYFESLPVHLRNGVLHGYKIRYSAQSQEGSHTHLTTVTTADKDSTSARLELQTDVQYNVTVVAYNRIGESQGCEPITIPPHREYENVDMMEAEENGTHVTFWWDSPQSKDLQSIILVECSVPSKSSVVCQDSTQFITIPTNNKTSYSHKNQDTKSLVYSKAAVYKGGSSGLEPDWICVRPFNAEVVKPKFDLNIPDPETRAAGRLIKVMIQPPTCDDQTGRVLFYNLTWTPLPGTHNTRPRSVKFSGGKREYKIHETSESDRYEVKLQAVGHRGASEWTTMEYSIPKTANKPARTIIPIVLSVSVPVLILFGFLIAQRLYKQYGKCPTFRATCPPPVGLYHNLNGASGDGTEYSDIGSSAGYLPVLNTLPRGSSPPSQHPGPPLPSRPPLHSESSDGYSPTEPLNVVEDSSDDRSDSLDPAVSYGQNSASGSETPFMYAATERLEEPPESSGSTNDTAWLAAGGTVPPGEVQGASCMAMSDLTHGHGVSVDTLSTENRETESLCTDSDYGYRPQECSISF